MLYVPVGNKIAQYNYSNICPKAFHFLNIPQRESVIVSSGEKNCIWGAGSQEVSCRIDGEIPSTSVVVIPILCSHDSRYGECYQCGNNSSHNHVFVEFGNQVCQCQNSKTYPYCEGIKRTNIYVVPFPRLYRWGI